MSDVKDVSDDAGNCTTDCRPETLAGLDGKNKTGTATSHTTTTGSVSTHHARQLDIHLPSDVGVSIHLH